jgi:serine kinase of HPr protein (carbohydrate metabolism regulator)
MSLVPCKASSKKKITTLESIFRHRLRLLGIREILAPQGLKKVVVRPAVKCCRRITISKHQEGAIIILSTGAQKKLMALEDSLRQEFFSHLIFRKTALLIFAQATSLSVFLKEVLELYSIPTVISSLHEQHLESRIKALIREEIQQQVTVQGVTLEVRGKGILITGVSGIGKTTAALRAVPEGYLWIADDLAVVKKDHQGRLIISGHRKIKNYLHTERTGIVAVDSILDASQIKKKTQLAAVIEVIRTDADDISCQLIEKKILATRLPCLQMTISRTGYFNENLLKKALYQLTEVG